MQRTRRLALKSLVLVGVAFVLGDIVHRVSVDNRGERTARGVTADASRLRLVHGSPVTPPVDVYLGATKVLGDVSFGTVTEPIPVTPGTRALTLTRARSAVPLVRHAVTVGSDHRTVVVLSGVAARRGTAAVVARRYGVVRPAPVSVRILRSSMDASAGE
jgi:hypothetical protein